MGCSIHSHVEIKINNKWHHYNAPDTETCYPVFAKMAGVRNNHDIKPISEPKGLPDDITEITKLDSQWREEGHSHSWLSAKEITQLVDYIDNVLELKGKWGTGWWFDDNFGFLFNNALASWFKYGHKKSTYPKEIEDIRLVFWFDC